MKKFLALLCLLALLIPFCAGMAETDTEEAPPAAQETAEEAEGQDTPADEEPLPGELEFEGPFLAPGEAPVWTENSYTSENVAITITSRRLEIPINERVTQKSDVYIADIYVRKLEYFCRAFPGAKWGRKKLKITTLSKESGALLSMSGDSASNLQNGWVIVNGEVVRDGAKKRNRKRDLCILYTTGEMVTVPAQEIDSEAIRQAAENGDIWQVFLFGPQLLDSEGRAMTKFNSDVGPVNPRSVIGYYGPGHYCMVQLDGRQTASKLEKGKKNKGVTLKNLSLLMEELGCKAAYNLDGGRTSQMYFNGQVISSPQQGGRSLGDIVMVRDPAWDPAAQKEEK